MGAFLFYLLKSGCCLVVFYIFFKLLMSRSTFFRFNRITLLVGLLGCTLLPLIELTTTEETFLHTPLYAIQLDSCDFSFYIWSGGFGDTDLVVFVHLSFDSVDSYVREKTVWKLCISDSSAANCFI